MVMLRKSTHMPRVLLPLPEELQTSDLVPWWTYGVDVCLRGTHLVHL